MTRRTLLTLALALALSIALSSIAFATVDYEAQSAEIMQENPTSSNDRTGREAVRQEGKMSQFRDEIEVDTRRSFSCLNERVIIPDKNKLKKELLMHLNENKEMNVHNINNIDNLVNEIVTYFENTQNNDFMAQDFRLYPHWHSWYQTPKREKTTKYITYTNNWIGIDAYRSAAGGSVSKTVKNSISYKIGLSGSSEIIKYLNLSAGWEKTKKNEIEVKRGTTCPAWTAVWWRPYTRWYLDEYKGVYRTEYYNTKGQRVYENRVHTTTNKRLKDDMTEFYSRTNSSKNRNATTPSAPTGCPNAWW